MMHENDTQLAIAVTPGDILANVHIDQVDIVAIVGGAPTCVSALRPKLLYLFDICLLVFARARTHAQTSFDNTSHTHLLRTHVHAAQRSAPMRINISVSA